MNRLGCRTGGTSIARTNAIRKHTAANAAKIFVAAMLSSASRNLSVIAVATNRDGNQRKKNKPTEVAVVNSEIDIDK